MSVQVGNVTLRLVSHGDLILPEDHNNIRQALIECYNEYMNYYSEFVKHPKIIDLTNSLPIREKGEYIYPSDWNDVLYILKLWLEELEARGYESYQLFNYKIYLSMLREVREGYMVLSFDYNNRIYAIRELYNVIQKYSQPIEKVVYILNQDDWDTAKQYIVNNTVIICGMRTTNISTEELRRILQIHKVKLLVAVDTEPSHHYPIYALKGILYMSDYAIEGYSYYNIMDSRDRQHFGSDKVEAYFDYPNKLSIYVPNAIQWVNTGDDGGYCFVKIRDSYVPDVPYDGMWKDVNWLDKYLTWLPHGYPQTYTPIHIIQLRSGGTDVPAYHQYPTLQKTLEVWARLNGYKYMDLR